MQLCERAQKIVQQQGETCVRQDGDCTPLYYHILECDKCAELRNEN